MTKESEQLIDELLSQNSGSLDWDRVKTSLVGELNVMSQTARKYIRDSEVADVVVDQHGNRTVIRAELNDGETVVKDEGDLIQPVGKPTGRNFSNLSVLEEIDHPWIPRGHKSGYFRRKVTDKLTDVSVVTGTMDLPDYSTLLIGQHGIGKDALVLHICANINQPVIRPTMSSNSGDLIDLLIGHYSPTESGDLEFRKGLLTISLENGYCFIADEINMIDGQLQSQMNAMLEDADSAQLTIPETNEVIRPHPEFRFVGTMNPPTMEYGGAGELNDAFKSRFVSVKIPPLDTESEKKVVASNTYWDDDSDDLSILLDSGGLITSLRNLYDAGKIQTWISTREVIKIGQLAETFGDTRQAAIVVLTGVVHPDNEDAVETAISDDSIWQANP